MAGEVLVAVVTRADTIYRDLKEARVKPRHPPYRLSQLLLELRSLEPYIFFQTDPEDFARFFHFFGVDHIGDPDLLLSGARRGVKPIERGDHYVILPILPELLREEEKSPIIGKEYSSADNLMSTKEVWEGLHKHHLLLEDQQGAEGELLR